MVNTLFTLIPSSHELIDLIILTVENIGKGITKEELDLWKHTIMKGHILFSDSVYLLNHLCRVLEKCQIILMRFAVRDLRLLH